jgi:hypothetical protein
MALLGDTGRLSAAAQGLNMEVPTDWSVGF